jgi:hypothetical protein
MRSLYALLIGALLLSNALPSSAQTTPAPSPSPAPLTAPFVAPGDWVQLPRGFTLTEIKNLWRGPRTGGPAGGGVFAQAVLPLPSGIVAALLAQLRTVLASSKTKQKLTMTTASPKICGATASVSTLHLGGAKPAIIETTTLSQRGLTYATVYVRTSSKPESAIELALRSACPLPNGGLPDATPPAGWSAVQKGLDFELGGVWLGNAPMQLMTLLKARGMPDLMSAAQAAPATTSGTQHSVKYRASMQKLKFCGTPGLLATAQFIVPPGFGMTYSVAVAQGMDGTFVLSYFHPSSYTDAGAQQSMRSLCAGAPLPSPSPSPSATPLPFP